jgi:hypothetical protein
MKTSRVITAVVVLVVIVTALLATLSILGIPVRVNFYRTAGSWTGTFEIVYVPCPANVQCNPQYLLKGDDGNEYQLIWTRAPMSTCLHMQPNNGEHIRVTGTISYNTQASCFLNGQATPCQPIGVITVSSWTSV